MSGSTDVPMIEVPGYFRMFSNFKTYQGVITTQDADAQIQIELRHTAFEQETFYTIIEEKGYLAHSIGELLRQLPSLVSLTIKHPIQVSTQGSLIDTELNEVFLHVDSGSTLPLPPLRARLEIPIGVIESELVETLQDAVWDLQKEAGGDLWLVTCFHCALSGHARDYLTSDRYYWCYRDVIDTHQRGIAEISKLIASEHRYSGAYYVDAFHTCPAWRPLSTRTK